MAKSLRLNGLSPILAGRMGLWLLSRREIRAASKRTVYPHRVCSGSFAGRAAQLLCRWTVREYPGYRRILAAMLGVSEATAKRYLSATGRLPVRHAARLADYLQNHAAQCEALAAELREVVSRNPENWKPRNRGIKFSGIPETHKIDPAAKNNLPELKKYEPGG